MANRRTRAEVLNRDFLETRAKILELAASLDRVDRAQTVEGFDPRRSQLRNGLEALLADEPGRAEIVQLIFSLEYDPEWRTRFELKTSGAGH